ncbi:MAG TPA: DNA repair protein RecO [Terracidiphilus sp.]|nr:DNA repair protein RecO [Terracidiphilus sp.]
MSVLTSEAVVLRTWPVHEADLIVSFFTRDYGRMKGVAKSALKSRKRFGGALEPMTVARAWFAERPRQELVRLDQLEIVRSPLAMPVDHARMAVLSFFAELLDEALPEHDPQETVFRLLLSVLEQTTAVPSEMAQGQSSGLPSSGPQSSGPPSSGPWMALTYFSLWMTRLMGLLPDVAHCTACGEALQAGDVWFQSYGDGLFCAVHRGSGANALGADSWQLAQRMLRSPVSAFAGEQWPRRRGTDLRRFALQSLERHVEKKLRTAEALGRLGG